MPHLGGRRAQELAPCRRHREEIAHLDQRARRRRGRSGVARAAGVRLDGDRRGVGRPARHQADGPGRRDARQRLAAKSQRRDRFQIVRAGELAGRVPRERQQRVLGRHALAVVAHRDALDPAAPQRHLDVPRAGVERVLDQLLHHRGGAFDHLSCGDLPLHDRGEYGDLPHASVPAQRMKRGSFPATQPSISARRASKPGRPMRPNVNSFASSIAGWPNGSTPASHPVATVAISSR